MIEDRGRVGGGHQPDSFNGNQGEVLFTHCYTLQLAVSTPKQFENFIQMSNNVI
jgi:hypothetical protein